jgi:tyrosinase co-factor MelC1
MNRREVLTVAALGTVSVGLSVGRIVANAIGTEGELHDYAEIYRGRRIAVSERDGNATVYIDGRRLHLMKYGEAAYLSPLCHYEFAPSPLAAARRAVDQLRGANLLETGPHQHA